MRGWILAIVLAAAAAVPPPTQKIAFARVFPNHGQIGLFIAAADGADEHPLLASQDIDYDPAWSPDGAWIVFTSEREGSADLYRVRPNGADLERLTDNPAYDDQAAFSPDGRRLAFVTTRAGGRANLWTLDLQSRRAAPLTSGAGGDFRPSWSPDGQWIAFSSDRGSTMPFAHGRWEHLQIVDLYLIHPDGSGLTRITEPGNFCGSPKWAADSRRVIAYCMTAEQTLTNRQGRTEEGDTRLVTIDIATRAAADVPAEPGIKIAPVYLPSKEIAYIRKNVATAGIYYGNGKRGPRLDVRSASWSPDGARVVFHKRLPAPPTTWRKTFSRLPEYELTLTQLLPSFNPTGDQFTVTGRPTAGEQLGSSVAVAASGTDTFKVIFRRPDTNVLAPQWSPRGDLIIFGIGHFGAFFNGFHDLFLNPPDRVDGGAQVAVVAPNGSGFREVTTGPNNNGFPSMAPDGRRFVYRSFGPDGGGLRIMDIETKSVVTLTKGYDNFPLWSPRGDLIMFSRQAEGDYEIYTIKPDGTGVRRLTFSRGNDAHQAWSPDGERIVFASSRMGFKDEALYTDAPQPYGELFVMRYDGSNVQQLTDNQWEDGTPAWQPSRPLVTRR